MALQTRADAALAVDATARAEGDLRAELLGFRVMAEHAAQGAALEEHHAADAGAVLQTVALDVHDERLSHGIVPPADSQATPSRCTRSRAMKPNL